MLARVCFMCVGMYVGRISVRMRGYRLYVCLCVDAYTCLLCVHLYVCVCSSVLKYVRLCE